MNCDAGEEGHFSHFLTRREGHLYSWFSHLLSSGLISILIHITYIQPCLKQYLLNLVLQFWLNCGVDHCAPPPHSFEPTFHARNLLISLLFYFHRVNHHHTLCFLYCFRNMSLQSREVVLPWKSGRYFCFFAEVLVDLGEASVLCFWEEFENKESCSQQES